jgi:porphobilinogen deaminase
VPSRHLRIGTRGGPMVLHQTALVRDRLVAAHLNSPQTERSRSLRSVQPTVGCRAGCSPSSVARGLFVKESQRFQLVISSSGRV